MIAAEGPRPEEFVIEAWGLVGCILEKFLFLRPCSKVIESYDALGPFSRWCHLQREQVAHLEWGWLAPALNVIQGFQGTENPVPIGL